MKWLKDNWRGPGIFGPVAEWMNRVSNFINQLEIVEGSIAKGEDLRRCKLYFSGGAGSGDYPFKVTVDSTGIVVASGNCYWYDPTVPELIEDVVTAGSYSLPAAHTCIYIKLTVTDDSTVAWTMHESTAGSAASARAGAIAYESGSVTVYPLATVDSAGVVTPIWTGGAIFENRGS